MYLMEDFCIQISFFYSYRVEKKKTSNSTDGYVTFVSLDLRVTVYYI